MSNKKYGITLNGAEHEVTIAPNGSSYNVTVDGITYPVSIRSIELDNISNHVTGLSGTEFDYTGEQITPSVLTDGTVTINQDYTVTYSNNVEVGTGTCTVEGQGNYQGVISFDFTIKSTEPEPESPSTSNPDSADTNSGTPTDGSDGSESTPTESTPSGTDENSSETDGSETEDKEPEVTSDDDKTVEKSDDTEEPEA